MLSFFYLGSYFRLPFPLFSFLEKKEKELHSNRGTRFIVSKKNKNVEISRAAASVLYKIFHKNTRFAIPRKPNKTVRRSQPITTEISMGFKFMKRINNIDSS